MKLILITFICNECYLKVIPLRIKYEVILSLQQSATVSAKTLHVSTQILAYFRYLKFHNSVTVKWNNTNVCSLIASLIIQLHFGIKQMNIHKTMDVLRSFV